VLLGQFDCWAEPLAVGIKRVVIEDLGNLLPTARVSGFPPEGEVSPDYQVSLRVVSLDAAPGGATLEVWWSILDAGGATVSPPTRFDSLAAESQALAQLSREVAGKLQELGLPAPRGRRP